MYEPRVLLGRLLNCKLRPGYIRPETLASADVRRLTFRVTYVSGSVLCKVCLQKKKVSAIHCLRKDVGTHMLLVEIRKGRTISHMIAYLTRIVARSKYRVS